MATILWLAVNPSTGLPVAEFPGLRATSTLTTIMGTSGGNVNVELPITDRLPSNWRIATEPRRMLIVAQYDDPDETVLWAGFVETRETGSGGVIRLSMVDMHGYMDRQYLQASWHTWEGADPTDMASAIMGHAMTDYLPGSGNATLTGVHADFRWEVDESAQAALSRLVRETGAVEWTLNFRWMSPDVETEWGFTRRLWMYRVIAPRVGRAATATVEPHLLSGMAWRRTEDWSSGRGATRVVAVGQSAGDGDPPVASAPTEIVWPPTTDEPMRLIETVSVDTDNPLVLQSEAQRLWAEMSAGTAVYDVDLVLADTDLILGRDIGIGDDVLVDLVNPDLPELDHTLAARLVGWTAEPDVASGQIVRVKPILVERGA